MTAHRPGPGFQKFELFCPSHTVPAAMQNVLMSVVHKLEGMELKAHEQHAEVLTMIDESRDQHSTVTGRLDDLERKSEKLDGRLEMLVPQVLGRDSRDIWSVPRPPTEIPNEASEFSRLPAEVPNEASESSHGGAQSESSRGGAVRINFSPCTGPQGDQEEEAFLAHKGAS